MTDGRVPLSLAFESAETKRRYNRRLFGIIAPRYDLITRVLSYGQDQRWKRHLVKQSQAKTGERALDLACGTGDLAFALAARGARVLALDLTLPMLAEARRKPGADRLAWIAGDIAALPIASESVDVVTTGYGLRNVPGLVESLEEISRVLKPGGRFLSLDFNRPDGALLRAAYLGYLSVVGAALGRVLHGDGDTYRYIAASLARYPGAGAVVETMRRAGFADAAWTPVLGGLMAVHTGTKGA